MVGKQELLNSIVNIEPIMKKCFEGKKLTEAEQVLISTYYLEVKQYLTES